MSDETLKLARDYQDRKQFTKASNLYIKVLPVQEAFEGLVESLVERNRLAEAITRGEDALKRKLVSHRLLLALGRAYLQSGDPASALEKFDAASGLRPEDGVTQMAQGDALLGLGSHDAALACYLRAAASMPSSVEPLMRLYRFHMARGERDQARTRLRHMLEADHNLEELRDKLTELLEPFAQENDFLTKMDDVVFGRGSATASLIWANALIDHDHGAAAFRHLAIVLESNRTELHDTALSLLNPVLDALDPAAQAAGIEDALRATRSPAALIGLASRLTIAKRIDEAVRALRDALLIPDDDATVLGLDQLVGMESEQLGELLHALRKLLKKKGKVPWERWGMLFARLGMMQEATEFFARAESLRPHGLLLWGDALAARHDVSAASEKYLQALEQHPHTVPDWFSIARAIDLRNEPSVVWRRAAEAGLAAIQSGPAATWAFKAVESYLEHVDDAGFRARFSDVVRKLDGSEPQIIWGQTLEWLGFHAEAAPFFRSAAERDPDDARPHYYLALMYVTAARNRAGAAVEPRDDEPAPRYDLTAFRAEIDSAIAELDAAVKADPEFPLSYSLWSDALDLLDSGAGAGKVLEEAFAGGPPSAADRIDATELSNLRDESARRVAQLLNAIERNCDGNDHEIYRETAIRLINKHGFMDSAEQLFDRLLALDPSDSHAYYVKGHLLNQRGDPQAALDLLKKSIDLDASFMPARTLRAECFTSLGRHNDANREFEDAFNAIPEDDIATRQELLTNWSGAQRDNGDFDSALKTARKALDMQVSTEDDTASKSREYWLWFGMGITYSEMWQYDRAREAYRRAIALDDKHPYAYHNIAEGLQTLGSYAESRVEWARALEHYQRRLPAALRERDADFCVYFAEALLQMKHDYAGAEKLLFAARALAPENARAHSALTAMLLEQKRELERSGDTSEVATIHARARASYNRAHALLTARPYQPAGTKAEIGELHLLMGDAAKARAAFTDALRLRETARAYNGLGEAYTLAGDYRAAIRAFQGAIGCAQADLVAHVGLARAQQKAGRVEEAERSYRKILEAAPTHLDALLELGELCIELGEKSGVAPDQAEQYFEESVRLLTQVIEMSDEQRPATVKGSIASARYLHGYVQIKLYNLERNRKRRATLRESALKDFAECEKSEVEAAAKRAIKQLQGGLPSGTLEAVLQIFVPYAVAFVGVVLIILAQVFLFTGVPTHLARVSLTPSSFVELRNDKQAVAAVPSLKSIQNLQFENMQALVERARNEMGRDWRPAYEQHLRHAASNTYVGAKADLGMPSYLSLIFTSLALLMAAAFLPRLTSLKLPGVEFQKEKSEVTETTRSISISRNRV